MRKTEEKIDTAEIKVQEMFIASVFKIKCYLTDS
jgi:hypothetical protein